MKKYYANFKLNNTKIFIYYFSYDKNRGQGYAIKFALSKLKNIYNKPMFINKNNFFFIMDFDLPFELSIINLSIDKLNQYDLINIDRTKLKNSYNVSFFRKIMHKTLIYIIKILFFEKLKGIDDFVGGFKAFNNRFFDFIKNKKFLANTSIIQLEILIYALFNNFKIYNIFPVFNKDTEKYSTFNIFKTIKFIFKVLLELFIIKLNLNNYKQ